MIGVSCTTYSDDMFLASRSTSRSLGRTRHANLVSVDISSSMMSHPDSGIGFDPAPEYGTAFLVDPRRLSSLYLGQGTEIVYQPILSACRDHASGKSQRDRTFTSAFAKTAETRARICQIVLLDPDDDDDAGNTCEETSPPKQNTLDVMHLMLRSTSDEQASRKHPQASVGMAERVRVIVFYETVVHSFTHDDITHVTSCADTYHLRKT